MAKKQKPGSVHTFKVALAGDKKIWRRISLLGNQTLDDLHEAIFEAFDRYDDHLYSFCISPPGTRGRRVMVDGIEYTHPEALGGPDPWGDEDERKDASRTRVDSLGLIVGQELGYLFDFGDNWEHVITVEQAGGQPDGKPYPRIIEKNGDSPPQYPDDEDDDDGEDDEWEDDEQ